MTFVCPNGHQSEAGDFCDTCGAKIDPDAQPSSAATPSAEGDGSASSQAPAEQICPNCQTPNAPDALFCEACGYDFTTGALPRGTTPAPEAAEAGAEPGPETGTETGTEPSAAAGAEPGGEATGSAGGSTGAPDPAAPPFTGNVSPSLAPQWVAEVWVDPDWYAVQDAPEPMPSPGLPVVVPLASRSLLIGRVSTSRNIHPDIDCTSDTGVSRRHAQLTTDGQRWFVEDLGSSNGTFVAPASGPLPEIPIAVGPRTELDEDDRVYVGAWTRIVVREATEDERGASA